MSYATFSSSLLKKCINQCEHSNIYAGISRKGPPGYLLLLDHISRLCKFTAVIFLQFSPSHPPPIIFKAWRPSLALWSSR